MAGRKWCWCHESGAKHQGTCFGTTELLHPAEEDVFERVGVGLKLLLAGFVGA